MCFYCVHAFVGEGIGPHALTCIPHHYIPIHTPTHIPTPPTLPPTFPHHPHSHPHSQYGCLVVNAPTANTVAAAEHGIALMCAMSRYVPQADKSMKAGKWERTKYVGVSLVGKTLAIMGFGKVWYMWGGRGVGDMVYMCMYTHVHVTAYIHVYISTYTCTYTHIHTHTLTYTQVGGEVARRARGLGMTIIAYDPYANEEKARAQGVTLVPFDEALATGDFFSLHMPLTPQTKQIFNDEAFGKMKPGARIINVARGGVVDDDALVRALDAGTVAMAALDVFDPEPPVDNPLVGREDVICTPHLGASTMEAQEGVSVEIAEAVVEALKGELSPTAVNAPMVPREVLLELQPFVSLAEGLGRAAVQLVGETGFSDITIEYASPRGDDLDTRLLRAMVIKGVLEQITTSTVNIVNADLLAKNRGLTIKEVKVPGEGKEVLSTMQVSVKATSSKFSSALDRSSIKVGGTVRNGLPFITRIGPFEVEVGMEGCVMLVQQTDKPGIISGVSNVLASNKVNISYMTVCRTGRGEEAIMAIGVDEEPPAAVC